MTFLIRLPFRHFLLAVALTILPTVLVAQTLSDTPWTEYFGSSSGPHNNWGQTNRIGSNRSSQIRSALNNGDDIVLGDTNGLNSAEDGAKVTLFMNSIEADGGRAFRQAVFDRAVSLRQTQLTVGAADQVLFWQFGNEITAKPWVLNLRAWAGERVRRVNAGDPWIIPYYAEYYLAPAVQAIREAEVATGYSIPVVLGSIGNASEPKRRAFLQELLNYELLGSYAGTLAGQRVADIVDYVDIHYMWAKGAHVADSRGRLIKHLKGSYVLALDEIHDPWVATGVLDGILTTEEIGRKVAIGGYGGFKATVIAARSLHYWSEKGSSSDEGRILFWGTTMGPDLVSANSAMATLYDFLGPTPLIEIPGAAVPPADDWETYVFESVNNANKRVAFVIPSWADIQSNTFTEFTIDAINWRGSVDAEVHILGEGTSSTMDATVDRQNDVLTVTVPTPIVPDTARPPAIVIFLQK